MDSLSRLEGSLIRASAGLLSRSGRFASLLVMIYHRVVPAPDPLLPGEPDAKTFDAQMALISENFNVLPLSEAVTRLRAGTLPSRAICVTFDDGYANNCEVALPILTARSIPATVFVAPGFLNGGLMFNDAVIETVRRSSELDLSGDGLRVFRLFDSESRIRAAEEIVAWLKYLPPEERLGRAVAIAEGARLLLPTDLMMTNAQVRRLARSGIEIGAHTVNHPILSSVDATTALEEIRCSKQCLEELIGGPVRSFAYPNGGPVRDYDKKHVAMARESGFDYAVSTAWGAATITSDLFQIPRVAPWDVGARRYCARLIGAYGARKFRVA